MKTAYKMTLAGTVPAFLAGLLGAGAQTQPSIDAPSATQPATAPGTPVFVRDDSPLVVPDGSTPGSPVQRGPSVTPVGSGGGMGGRRG